MALRWWASMVLFGAFAIWGSACIDDQLIVCGSQLCPVGSTCGTANDGTPPVLRDVCLPPQVCGDGNIVGTEQCESDNLGQATCASLLYYGGELLCNADCTFDVSACAAAGRCGDGVLAVAQGEQCEGAGATAVFDQRLSCTDFFSFDAGLLDCDPVTCQVKLDNCQRFGWQRTLPDADFVNRVGPLDGSERLWSSDDAFVISSSNRNLVLIWWRGSEVMLPPLLPNEYFGLATGQLTADEKLKGFWLVSPRRALFFDVESETWVDHTPPATTHWLAYDSRPFDVWTNATTLYVTFEETDRIWWFDTQWTVTNPYSDNLIYSTPPQFMASHDQVRLVQLGSSISCEVGKLESDGVTWTRENVLYTDGGCTIAADGFGGMWGMAQGLLFSTLGNPTFDEPDQLKMFNAGRRIVGAGTPPVIFVSQALPRRAMFVDVPSGVTNASGKQREISVLSEQGLFQMPIGDWYSGRYLDASGLAAGGLLERDGIGTQPRLALGELGEVIADVPREPAYVGECAKCSRLLAPTGDRVQEYSYVGEEATIQTMMIGYGSLRLTYDGRLYGLGGGWPEISPIRRLWHVTDSNNPYLVAAIGDHVFSIIDGEPYGFEILTSIPFSATELEGRAVDDLYSIAGQQLWHFDGTAWAVAATVDAPLRRLWVSSTGVVWMIGADTIYRYAQQQVTKTQFPDADFRTIHGAADDDIFVGGRRSADGRFTGLVRFTGQRWTELRMRADAEVVLDLVRFRDGIIMLAQPRNDARRWFMLSAYLPQ